MGNSVCVHVNVSLSVHLCVGGLSVHLCVHGYVWECYENELKCACVCVSKCAPVCVSVRLSVHWQGAHMRTGWLEVAKSTPCGIYITLLARETGVWGDERRRSGGCNPVTAWFTHALPSFLFLWFLSSENKVTHSPFPAHCPACSGH